MNIALSQPAAFVLDRLHANKFEAYAVGGCIRDSLMGTVPHDWDVATSALPIQITETFQNTRAVVIPTGIKHGTVTIVVEGTPIEVTTFRTEQSYSDHRHPDAVSFTPSLAEDLKRRDFTVNAIAYSPEKGVIDPFHGQKDLANGIIRCVGQPDSRFEEDALRIIRALRFSSTLGFDIDRHTADSLKKKAGLLHYVAQERISSELSKLICGEYVLPVLLHYSSVIGVFLPEILPSLEYSRQAPGHVYRSWEQIARSVACAVPLLPVRLSLLFHIFEKPGYPFSGSSEKRSPCRLKAEETARLALMRLRYSAHTVNTVTTLLRYQGAPLRPERKELRYWVNRIGAENLRLLLLVKRADAQAAGSFPDSSPDQWEQAAKLLDRIIAEGDCCSVKQLSISGCDLLACGFSPGPQVGRVLNHLLTEVIEEQAVNEKEALLQLAKKLLTDTKKKKN